MFISSHRHPICPFKSNMMEDTLEKLLMGCSLTDDYEDEKTKLPPTPIKYYKSHHSKTMPEISESNKEKKTFVKNGILFSYKPKSKDELKTQTSSDPDIESLTKEIRLDLNGSSKSSKTKDDNDNEIEKLIANISLKDNSTTDSKAEKVKAKDKEASKNSSKSIYVLVKRGPDRIKQVDIRHSSPYEKQHVNRKSLSGGVVVLKSHEEYTSGHLVPSSLDNQEYQENYTESDVLNRIFEKYPDILKSLESDQETETIFQIPTDDFPVFSIANEQSPISIITQESANSTPSPQISISSPSFYDSPQYVQSSPNVGYNPPSVEVVNSNNAENYMYEHGANLTRLSFSKSPESITHVQSDQPSPGGSVLSPNLFASIGNENSFNISSPNSQPTLLEDFFQKSPDQCYQAPVYHQLATAVTPERNIQKAVNNSTMHSWTRSNSVVQTNYTKIASKRAYMCCKTDNATAGEHLGRQFLDLPTEKQAAILKRITKETDLGSCLDGLLSTWNEDQTNRLPQVETLYLVCKQLLLDEKMKMKFVELYSNGLTLLDRVLQVCYRTPMVVKFIGECMLKVMKESPESPPFEIDQVNSSGNRLLHRAVMRGTNCEDALAALFSLKNAAFHINDLNSDGYSPLHLACSIHNINGGQCSCSYMAHVLIKHGLADVNLKDGRAGETPLHMAINSSTCGLELVNLLLKHGANPNVTNYRGSSSLNLAETVSRSQPKHHFSKEVLFNLKNFNSEKKIPG